MTILEEDGIPVVGSPTNQTPGIKGPVEPIGKNIARRIIDMKKKRKSVSQNPVTLNKQ